MKTFLIILIFFLVSGCAIFKRTRSDIHTETVIKVDTVLIIKKDTVRITAFGYLHDTVRIENNVAVARSYYDKAKGRMILTLQGKSFSVPLTIYKRTITDAKTNNVERKQTPAWFYLITVLGITITIYAILNKIKNE